MTLNEHVEWVGSGPDSQNSDEKGWLSVSWKLVPGAEFSASCRLSLPKVDSPFWCLPGLFWGDNQQDTTKQYYPRFCADLRIPRRFESSFWEFDVWRQAQPLAAVYDGTAWWVLEVMPHGLAGAETMTASIGFEFQSGCPVLVASLPADERPYRPVGHDYTRPQKGAYCPGDAVEVSWALRASRHVGGKNSLLNLLEDNYHSFPGEAHEGDYSAEKLARATRNALMKWHYDAPSPHFRYTVAFDRVGQQIAEGAGCSLDRHEMPLGWVSGWVVFEALLDWSVLNTDIPPFQAVEDTWQNLLEAGLISPSGFWWTRYAPRRTAYSRSPFDSAISGGMDGNWMPNPYHLHMRTLGDAVLRAARVLSRHGDRLPFAKDLAEQVVTQAALVAKMARRGWPLPLSVDARTGAPAGLKGTAGMIWISVWAELARMGLWKDTNLIAEALDFYRSAVESGQLYGAPEDVGECMTSEDAYIAINAYMDGYRFTQRREDLESCQTAARWLYLWQKSFNHSFDRRTLIGVYDLKSRGGQFASFKNNHLHIYGLDAEDSLIELSAAMGDDRWAKLAEDHWRFAAQLVSQVDGQFNAYEGMVAEQFYFVDWSALGNSVCRIEEDERRAVCDVGPHYRNHGNVAGFSHAWCTAMVLSAALRRIRRGGSRDDENSFVPYARVGSSDVADVQWKSLETV